MPIPTNQAVMLSSVSFAGTTFLSQWSKHSARGVSVTRIRTRPAASWKMRRATDLRIAGEKRRPQIRGMRAPAVADLSHLLLNRRISNIEEMCSEPEGLDY